MFVWRGGTGEMVANDFGKIAQHCWTEIPNHFDHVIVDEFVIMPNHMHGIIAIIDDDCTDCRGMACHAPTVDRKFAQPIPKTLATIVGSYKSAVTKRINEIRHTPANPVWQRNYYEHIVRNDESLHHVQQYILNNPWNWHADEENPVNVT